MFRTVPILSVDAPLPALPGATPRRGRRLTRRRGKRSWPILAAATALAAGLSHAASWLWPGLIAGTWIGHALLIALGTVHRPRAALAWGMLAGAVGIGLVSRGGCPRSKARSMRRRLGRRRCSLCWSPLKRCLLG